MGGVEDAYAFKHQPNSGARKLEICQELGVVSVYRPLASSGEVYDGHCEDIYSRCVSQKPGLNADQYEALLGGSFDVLDGWCESVRSKKNEAEDGDENDEDMTNSSVMLVGPAAASVASAKRASLASASSGDPAQAPKLKKLNSGIFVEASPGKSTAGITDADHASLGGASGPRFIFY